MELRRHIRRAGALLATTAVVCIAMMGGVFASTAFAATDDIASGTCPAYSSDTADKTCKWVIDRNGTLTVSPSQGTEGIMPGGNAPWHDNLVYIKKISFSGNVKIGLAYSLNLFKNCSNATELDLNNLDTSQVKSFAWAFSGCSRLEVIKGINGLKTDGVNENASYEGMFYGCNSLKQLDLSDITFKNASTISQIFLGCGALEKLSMPVLDTPTLKDMSSAFVQCSSLKSIDFNNFNTSSVTNMKELFALCESLTEVKNLKSGTLNNISSMFLGCKSIDGSAVECFMGLDTSKIKDFSSVFNRCSSLTHADITNKITLYALSLDSLFRGCSSLKEVKGLETINTEHISSISHMFDGCKSLKTLDLSALNLSIAADDAAYLFDSCTNLTTIYDDGGFVITNPNEGYPQFDGCDKLVGGNGTSVNGRYWQTDEDGSKELEYLSTTAEMARIDGGPNSNTPGYFTAKDELPHVHQLIDWSTKANCTQPGYRDGKQCSECGTIIDRGTYISSRDHTWPETYTVENKIDATDNANGSYDKVWRCAVCNEVLRSQHVTIKSKAFLYPTHTLDGTVIPSNMLFKELDKKKLTDAWTKEEVLFYISQGMCLIEETIDWRTKNWDTTYVSEESAMKIASLAFRLFDGKAAYSLANNSKYASCSPKEFSSDNDEYKPDHPTHLASHDYFDSDSYDDCAFWLLNRYCKAINLSANGAYAALTDNTYIGGVDDSLLGNLIIRALPNGTSAAQLNEIGASTLCNAVADATSCKELKTNAALYKAIGDYIIANASGADQIAVANKIMLERNASSGGSSSGSSSSGSSSSGGSISSGGSSSGVNSSEVNALKSEIASLKTELEKLKKGTANDETIAALQKTISSLEKNLDAMSSSLAQTQNALALSEMPRKISKSVMRAADSKVKIVLPTSASGAKVTFKPTSNKYLRVTKSGNVKVLKTLKKSKTYSIKVLATCGNQTKEVTLKMKAK